MLLNEMIQSVSVNQKIRVLLTYDICDDGFAYKFDGWPEDVADAIKETEIKNDENLMGSDVEFIRASILDNTNYITIVGLINN